MWGSYLRHVRVPWALSWDPTSRGLPGGARKGLCIKIRGTHLHVSYKGEKRAQPSSWAWLCGLSSRDEVTGDRLHGLLRGPPGFYGHMHVPQNGCGSSGGRGLPWLGSRRMQNARCLFLLCFPEACFVSIYSFCNLRKNSFKLQN